MVILLIIALVALSSWLVANLFRRLRRQNAEREWWVTFGGLLVVGALLGIKCAFFTEYEIGTRYRVGGFPMPIVFFHLEDGQWVDFPVPRFQAWAGVFTNVVVVTALTVLPLWLILLRPGRAVKH